MLPFEPTASASVVLLPGRIDPLVLARVRTAFSDDVRQHPERARHTSTIRKSTKREIAARPGCGELIPR